MSRALLIANPISGRGRGARAVPRFEKRMQELGHAVEVKFTAKRGDAREFARAARDYGAVVAVGGDGTVNEILNGFPPNAPPLAQIPIGTANVLAKAFGLPRDPRRVAELVAAGHTADIDLGTANGRKFVLMASAGFDADVVEAFHAARTGTIRMHQYFTWSLRHILSYRTPTFRVTADGTRLPDASFVLVSNVPSYGGPLAFTRDACPHDGLLDVLAYAPQGRTATWRLFLEAFAGDPWTMSGATVIRAKSVRIESDEAKSWQVDGDPGERVPVEVGVAPNALRLLVP
jgi:YegS/Rv2252/BmrU family lipid kinase